MRTSELDPQNLAVEYGDLGKKGPFELLFEAPNLSIANLVAGNPEAALRAILNHESLSPEERKKISAHMGLEKGHIGGGLADVFSNPVILIGMLGMLVTRNPTLLKTLPFVAGQSKAAIVNPIGRFLGSISNAFKGSKIPGVLGEIRQAYQSELETNQGALRKAMDEWSKATGRKELSLVEQRQLGASLDGLHNPDATVWKVSRSRIENLKQMPGWSDSDLARFDKWLEALNQKSVVPSRALDPAMADLRDKIKAIHDSIWDRLLANPDYSDAMRRALKRIDKNATMSPLGRKQANFLPHIRLAGHDIDEVEMSEFVQSQIQKQLDRLGGRGNPAQELAQEKVSLDRLRTRTGFTLPDADALESIGANPDLIDMVRVLSRDEAGVRHYYSLDTGNVLNRYYKGIARARAFSVPPEPTPGEVNYSLGERLNSELHGLMAEGRIHDISTIRDTVVPQLLGGLSKRQAEAAASWDLKRRWARQFVTEGGVLRKLLGEKTANRIQNLLDNDAMSSRMAVGHAISDLHYRGAMGFPNLIPTLRNFLQPIVNSYAFGTEHFVKGVKDTSKQMAQMTKDMLSGVDFETALSKANPAFAAQHLQLDTAHRQRLAEAFEKTAQRFGHARPSTLKRVGDALMIPFSTSELWNRMLQFNAGRSRALYELPGTTFWFAKTDKQVKLPNSIESPLVQKAADIVAAHSVGLTQFGGGPLQNPVGTLNLWEPFRQFSGFAARQAQLISGPMLEQPGYLFRTMATSGVLYEVAKSLGFDWTQGLLFGSIPSPSDQGVLSPLPVVPPFVQLLGGLGQGVAGDWSNFRRALPTLVPGGVGMGRMLGYIPGMSGAATFVGRPYADYDRTTPDGRIPVYARDNTLTGYYSPSQLMMKALGIGDYMGTREREVIHYLLSQRERVNKTKADLLQALYEGDGAAVADLQSDYMRAYPGAGPIPLRPSDLQTLHLRQDVSRMEKVLQSMPPDVRPQMSQFISTVFTAGLPQFLGMDGGQQDPLSGTILLREPYRARKLSDIQSRLGPSMHGQKLSDRLLSRGDDDEPGVFKGRRGPSGPYSAGPYSEIA